MRFLGEIVRLQIQAASLKVGATPRRYDPAPLLAVTALRLSPEGVASPEQDDDESILDVHHRHHPASKNRGGANGLSIGFTEHYRMMRQRFGGQIGDGVAGENILVATDRRIAAEEVTGGLVIVSKDGTRRPLHGLLVAAPCVEFARYALRWPDGAPPGATVTEALRYLDGGLRGYYASYAGPPAMVALGDRVLLA